MTCTIYILAPNIYLQDKKTYSVLAKEPLLKTKTDIVPYIKRLIPLYKEKDYKKWHKLIILGLRKRPELFLKDLIIECQKTENENSLNKNLDNINWNIKNVCIVAAKLISEISPFPARILQNAKTSTYKNIIIEAVIREIKKGNYQKSFFSMISEDQDSLKSYEIQKEILEIVILKSRPDYLKYVRFLDLNEDEAVNYINEYTDLAKIYDILSCNIIGIEKNGITRFSSQVVIVWKLVNQIDLEEPEWDILTDYLNDLRYKEYIAADGAILGCPKYVVKFLQCLDEETCLDIMTSIYDNPSRRSKILEDTMLAMHSERIYRDWIADILDTNDLSELHLMAKKLLMYYPENVDEILYVVDSVGIEKYYDNVVRIAKELNVDVSKIRKRNLKKVLDSSKNIGLSIYSRCISVNDSVEELLYSLHKRNVVIDSLKEINFNLKNIASICQVLCCLPELLIQENINVIQTLLDWMRYIPKVGWSITGEINENACEVITQIQIPRNADETLVIVGKSDLCDVTLSTRELSCYLLYQDIAYTDPIQVTDSNMCQCIDMYCEQNVKYKYLLDDIRRIASKKASEYVIELTKTNAISWEKKDMTYRSSMGEEEYFYIPFFEKDIGLLQIQIENRMTYTFLDEGNDTKLLREIAGIMPKTEMEKPKQHIIGVSDFLVRTTNYSCTNNKHELMRIKALVSVLKGTTIKEFSIDAAFCPQCNKYYILEREYLRIKAYGQICCKVVEIYELVKSGLTFNSWAEKSLLRIYGYNVNKNENLTREERQRILSFILENNIMTSFEIINHLEWQITTREGRRNMQEAIAKWEEDISFIRDYQYTNVTVRVRSIFLKNKIKTY